MCLRATHTAEAFVNQTLRATIDVQTESGPHRRLTVDHTGVARLTTNQWPVLAVVSAQFSPASVFPRTWTSIPATSLDVDESPPVNTGSAIPGGNAQGGNAVLIAPGYISWAYGRRGYRLQVQYLNGWPHAGLLAATSAGATSLRVDDVTGFGIATPTAPVITTLFDAENTETASVIGVSADNGSVGVSATGSGTLALASGTLNPHEGPFDNVPMVLVSTMPMVIQRAVILLAVHEALVRGSTATTVPRQPGALTHTGGGSDLDVEAFELLLPFKRMV